MLLQLYKSSNSLCLNNSLQVWLIVNQRYQIHLFRYIYWYDEISYLIKGRKTLLGYEICNEVS